MPDVATLCTPKISRGNSWNPKSSGQLPEQGLGLQGWKAHRAVFPSTLEVVEGVQSLRQFPNQTRSPKFEGLGINYSQAVYMVLQGQDALGQYLEWIKTSYGFKYGETQAYDLGKYIKQQHLLRVRKMMVLFKRITFRFHVNFWRVYLKSEFI